ncbi:MAG: AAA family ATPase [Flavobacteriaceae bacterium]|nr:MAG: AAA family ATPase [Flavobacteriaceae bacterium]
MITTAQTKENDKENKIASPEKNSKILPALQPNAQLLYREMQWIVKIVDTRLALFFGDECPYGDICEVLPPELPKTGSTYADYITQNHLGFVERFVLALSMAPHLQPEVLDRLYLKNSTYDKVFSQFGGWYDKGYTGFMPTVETAFFLLAHHHFSMRFTLQQLFYSEHFFIKTGVLELNSVFSHTPLWSQIFQISQEYYDIFTIGYARPPAFSTEFPAKRIHTKMYWEDLILPSHVQRQVLELKDWIDYSPVLLDHWGLGKKINSGYKCLFYGPPGTGKTLTACILGKSVQRDVYRIDLSAVVSKYIGETEKNLAKVFDRAEHKKWILFFDEADALFGKRTETKSSNDRYANQEVAYLLQRIEEFPGLVILASNFKEHIDKAFFRRFQSAIYFPMPSTRERLQLWKTSFSSKTPLEEMVNLKKIAEKHAISGGTIINVVRHCSVKAAKRKSPVILLQDIEEGIKKELQKEGISFF